jgi:hypothetical protein
LIFRLIRDVVQENPEKLNGIRWMANFLVAVQVNNFFEEIMTVLRDEPFGCATLVESLMKILDKESNGDIPSGVHTLQLEIALYVDAAQENADFCYNYEGDGALAFTAYEEWMRAYRQLQRVIGNARVRPNVPNVQRVAALIAPGDVHEQGRLINLTVAKAVPVLEKMEEDTNVRLRDTLQQLEACRLGNFEYIARNTLEALLIEVEKAQFLPWGVRIIASLKMELPAYKKIADQCDTNMDRWEFWRTYYLSLPAWYKLAEEIVLVMVSSASVERIFSLLNNSFDNQQQNSLNDYKEATVRLRYNENWRRKYD